jgi:hypothetical protein
MLPARIVYHSLGGCAKGFQYCFRPHQCWRARPLSTQRDAYDHTHGLEVGGRFFVEDFSTLIRVKRLRVSSEVGYEAFVVKDEVVFEG